MLFSRRAPPDWREAVRVSLWPRRTWSRSFRYARLRIRRVRAVPRSVALGMAAGVFVAVLPIPGVQMLAAAGLAWLVRGHSGIAALATFTANPVTYPLIWVASYAIGATILGSPVSNATRDLDMVAGLMAEPWSQPPATSALALWPILSTLALGAVPLAAMLAILAYLGVHRLLSGRRAVSTTPPIAAVTPLTRKSQRKPTGSLKRDRPPVKAAA